VALVSSHRSGPGRPRRRFSPAECPGIALTEREDDSSIASLHVSSGSCAPLDTGFEPEAARTPYSQPAAWPSAANRPPGRRRRPVTPLWRSVSLSSCLPRPRKAPETAALAMDRAPFSDARTKRAPSFPCHPRAGSDESSAPGSATFSKPTWPSTDRRRNRPSARSSLEERLSCNARPLESAPAQVSWPVGPLTRRRARVSSKRPRSALRQ